MGLSIGIAGAGLMGRMLAWQLAASGHRVTVFDRDTRQSGNAAGFTAAGMLTPFAEAESAEPLIFRLGLRSLALWPELIRQLPEVVRYHQRGSIILAHPADQQDLLHFKTQVKTRFNPSPEQFSDIDPEVIKTLEPELASGFRQGVYLPQEAWVSAEDFMAASANHACNLGVQWHEQTPVNRIEAHRIHSARGVEEFDCVIDSRGTGAKPQWPGLRGVRGELIWLQAPEVHITRLVRLMHPRYRLYLAPTLRDDIYIIGATQIESDDDSAISVRSALEMLSAVYSLHTGFAEARMIRTATNCRPALMDNLPAVACSTGLIRVNGLFRHGYLLAPAISEQILAWLSHVEQPPTTNLLTSAA